MQPERVHGDSIDARRFLLLTRAVLDGLRRDDHAAWCAPALRVCLRASMKWLSRILCAPVGTAWMTF